MAKALEADLDDPLLLAERWAGEGQGVALATVIETWGSSPRPVGSHLVIHADGRFQGSVSGGCVEGEVVNEAADVIATGTPRVLAFGVADETAWGAGLSCGGRIRVFVEKVAWQWDLATLAELNALRRQRRAAILVTDIVTGSTRLVREDEVAGDALEGELVARLRSGRSGLVFEPGKDEVFLAVHLPPPRLVVVGAVHIAQSLHVMARLAGFDVTIVDPRTAFATPERFPGCDIIAEWPQDVLPRLALDRFTAVAALTHDGRIDDLPLRAALDADCFYVGALGSRKTHEKRVQRLLDAGASVAQVARIRAPIGLPIAAQSPAEIAVAILAEVIDSLRKRGTQS
ncbi:MAG: XdhC family protein [Rhizobiales bacterium]|nr:XdhC family protein [Hyphomicrobiales bacterium]